MKAGEDLPLALGLLHLDSNVPDRASLIFFFWSCVEILESVLIDWVQIWRDFAPYFFRYFFLFFSVVRITFVLLSSLSLVSVSPFLYVRCTHFCASCCTWLKTAGRP